MKDNVSKKINRYNLNTSKKAFIWNMMGSLLNAASSMILLIIVTRIKGDFEGGVFAFAFSLSQLFLSIGNYEIRPYQSTDINRKYKFKDYLSARIISCTLMMSCAILYIFIFNYSEQKGILIFLLCFYRMIDAFADVFEGEFQVNDRLDLSGKSLSIRVIIGTIVFLCSMIITQNLIRSSIYMNIACIIWVIVYDFIICKKLFSKIQLSYSISKLRNLFLECFPLFIGAFLLMYIFNIPKFSIDKYNTSDIQNYFNILFMPVSIINLFSIFLFRPVLTKLAEHYNNFNIKKFLKIVFKLFLWILLLTLVCELGAYMLGIPVLSIIYYTDLSSYKLELLIMMIGGGFSALSTLLHYVITVMRKQKSLLIGYIITSVLGTIISNILISKYGIMGSAFTYVILMIILSLIFVITLMYYIIKVRNKIKMGRNSNE